MRKIKRNKMRTLDINNGSKIKVKVRKSTNNRFRLSLLNNSYKTIIVLNCHAKDYYKVLKQLKDINNGAEVEVIEETIEPEVVEETIENEETIEVEVEETIENEETIEVEVEETIEVEENYEELEDDFEELEEELEKETLLTKVKNAIVTTTKTIVNIALMPFRLARGLFSTALLIWLLST